MKIKQIDDHEFEIWRDQIEDLIDNSVKLNFPDYKVEDKYGKLRCDRVCSYLKDDQAVVFIAVENTTLFGWVWCHQIYRLNKKRFHIAEIAVDDTYQNQGIGKMLLDQIEIYATENGYQEIDLLVTRSNEVAVQFYEKSSYEVERYLMRKSL